MRSPVDFSSEKQFEQCVEALRTHLASLGGQVPQGERLRDVMAKIAGYDSANEVLMALQASERRSRAEPEPESVDADIFIYTLNEHQVMLQGRCDSPGILWKQGVTGFEDDLKHWREDILSRHLGLNNASLPVDVRCIEANETSYFVATLNLHSYALDDLEEAYRMMDYFVVNQDTPWPGLIVALRMIDRIVLEAAMSEYPESRSVPLRLHNALAQGQTIADVAEGNRTFLVEEFGEDMGPENVKRVFGGNRLKLRQADVKKRTGSTYSDDKAGLAKAASSQVVEDTWRALIQALSLTLTAYEGVAGRSLTAGEFVRLVRKHDAHLRRHMTRAFFLGHVPALPYPDNTTQTDARETPS